MSERKRVKRSTRADSIYSEPEGLIHDGPKDIVTIPSQNIWFVEKSNENPTTKSSDSVALRDYFGRKFSAVEAKMTNEAQTSAKS